MEHSVISIEFGKAKIRDGKRRTISFIGQTGNGCRLVLIDPNQPNLQLAITRVQLQTQEQFDKLWEALKAL